MQLRQVRTRRPPAPPPVSHSRRPHVWKPRRSARPPRRTAVVLHASAFSEAWDALGPALGHAAAQLRHALPPADGAVGYVAAAAVAASLGGFAYESANAVPAAPNDGASAAERGRGYVVGLVPFFLLVPFFSRPTFCYEIVKGRMWGFEQKQVRALPVSPAGLSLGTALFFLLRTALKDHQPPTANRHQLPTASNRQPQTADPTNRPTRPVPPPRTCAMTTERRRSREGGFCHEGSVRVPVVRPGC